MKRIFGFFVMAMALAWPGFVLGEEYTFGRESNSYDYSGAASGGSGKSGVYLAPRFLDALTNTGDIDGGGNRASKTHNTMGGAIAVGYYLSNLDSRVPLRAEIEYAARSNLNASWSRSLGTRKFEALFNVQTLQANLYWDIDLGMAIKPFIGGGMGMSFIYADYKLEGESSYSDSSTGFAWNAGAGVAYDLNESVTLDLAYRFAGYGHAEARRQNRTTKNYMTANEFLLGLRLNF